MQVLFDRLDEIFELLGISQKLTAPITDTELENLVKSLPFELPDSIKNLYKWHNGIAEFIPIL